MQLGRAVQAGCGAVRRGGAAAAAGARVLRHYVQVPSSKPRLWHWTGGSAATWVAKTVRHYMQVPSGTGRLYSSPEKYYVQVQLLPQAVHAGFDAVGG